MYEKAFPEPAAAAVPAAMVMLPPIALAAVLLLLPAKKLREPTDKMHPLRSSTENRVQYISLMRPGWATSCRGDPSAAEALLMLSMSLLLGLPTWQQWAGIRQATFSCTKHGGPCVQSSVHV